MQAQMIILMGTVQPLRVLLDVLTGQEADEWLW